MSVRQISRVWEQSRSRGNARLVLLAIADCANDEGSAWPSVATLAKKVRIHRTTVMRHVEELEALGELQVQREFGESNRYHLTVPDPSQSATANPSENATGRDLRLVADCDGTSRTGATPTSRTGATLSVSRTVKNRQYMHEGFDAFWSSYPRHEGKEAARAAWNKLAPDAELRATLHAAIKRQQAGRAWWVDPGGRMAGLHASTWLNKRRWTDEVGAAAKIPRAPGGTVVPSVEETRRQLAERERMA